MNNPFPLPFPVPHDFVFPTPVRVYSWDASHFTLQTTTVYNWNVSIERQLRSDVVARIAYVGSRTNHLLENENLNPAVYIPGSKLSTDQRRISAGKKRACHGRREIPRQYAWNLVRTVTPFDDLDRPHTSYHGQSTQTGLG